MAGPPARWNITDGPCRPIAMALPLTPADVTFHWVESSTAGLVFHLGKPKRVGRMRHLFRLNRVYFGLLIHLVSWSRTK